VKVTTRRESSNHSQYGIASDTSMRNYYYYYYYR